MKRFRSPSAVILLTALSATGRGAAKRLMLSLPARSLGVLAAVKETVRKKLFSPLGTPLAVALVAALVLWALGPLRPGLWAAPVLPGIEAGQHRVVASFTNGDPMNRVPREPMAIALLRGGDLLVADAGLGQVHRFGQDGRLRRSYTGHGEFRYPVGLAVAEDDRVWVADLWQQRIYRLDLAEDRLDAVATEPDGYRAPGGLSYRNGLLYVTDLSRQQVLVLNGDGRLVRVVGNGPGRGPGDFSYPNAVWVGEDGETFVSDSNNGRIQVFDGQGRLQRILQPHRLLLPRGLVQDRRGRLHVADTLAHDIAVLDQAGRIVARYGADADLTLPNGLAVRGQRLYVADRGNGRVIAWEIGDD